MENLSWFSFAECFFVLLLKGSPGQPHSLGTNFSLWMLLERVRFTLDGLECNKIGVSYEAFNGQPDFCSSPLWSCLHNQLWNFWDVSKLISYYQSLWFVNSWNLLFILAFFSHKYTVYVIMKYCFCFAWRILPFYFFLQSRYANIVPHFSEDFLLVWSFQIFKGFWSYMLQIMIFFLIVFC